MKPVIQVENISKSYDISHQTRASYGTLKDDFANLLKKSVGRGDRDEHETFWALKDVSFEVGEGEAFGIIGKNGSGKSTLLKILSRIVEPSSGTARLRGRVASLLEVGTGFHQELTGRENIFFNGSMLGMSRQEIRKKFNEIVEFSEIEQFLDTPVKFYSSGMYVRLAFAVAAHLDPEILILDEVLAVGDAQFQKKSMDKMLSIAKGGRTIIFVSHSMASVEDLCDRAMLLHRGKVKIIGDTSEVVDKYLGESSPKEAEGTAAALAADEASKSKRELTKIPIEKRRDRQGTGRVRFTELNLENHIEKKRQLKIKLALKNRTKTKFENFKLSIDIFDSAGNYISNCLNYTVNQTINLHPGDNYVTVTVDKINLVPGAYYINCFAGKDFNNSEIFDWVENAGSFRVPVYDYYRAGKPPEVIPKFVYLDHSYEVGTKL
ncbi:MAG: ABC transporter ATP-binding protein [Candidatus Saccharimonadales bacterium]